MRRGFMFSTDALLAALVLIGGLVLVASIADSDTDTAQLATVSHDVMQGLQAMQMYEVDDPWVVSMLANGSMNANLSVLEQIGHLWALQDPDAAQRLSSIVLNTTHEKYGLRLTIQDTTIYTRNTTLNDANTQVSTRFLSGIAEGEAITGSSASAYLKRVKDKRTNSFTVFGGFVGQGNISKRFVDLPGDANVTGIRLELAAGAPFDVLFNGVLCSSLTPAFTNGTPDAWDLTFCNASLNPGTTNTIEFEFDAPLNESYITGGFLRVKYKTEVLNENVSTSFLQYRLAGIDGIANLFDAFYVPGTLKNMSAYLHYYSGNSTYFQIGEKRVWEDNPNGTETVAILNDSYLRDPLLGKLDYDTLSNNTVPIRFAGFEPNQTIVQSGDADVVLITDFSGSMKKAVASWEQGNLGSDCDDAYADNDVRRTRLATCVDNVFVQEIMQYEGNRIWPVFLHDDEAKWYNNPDDQSAIEGYIDSYANGKEKTCYACAFNRAYDIFSNLSNSSRSKFIVFMSDGVPTHCADGSCTSTSTNYGSQQCEGLCDTQGACDATNIPAQCAECQTNNGGQQNAYLSANRSVNDFGVTIFTVGFGTVTDCSMANETLQELADMGNGTFQHSNESDQLKLIYENISQEIISRTTLDSQVAIVDETISPSILYDDSYINLTYEQSALYEQKQNTIALTLQSDQLCNPQVPLYEGQQLIESLAVSYSGIHWTDIVSVAGVTQYNLSEYYKPYGELGDPTVVHTDPALYSIGTNSINIETGDSPTNRTGCSANNSAIYTVLINLSTERSEVVPDSEGCNWVVQFEDDTFDNLTIPASYAGQNNCTYMPGNISYNPDDAYQLGTYKILERLDFRKEGKLFVNLREEDLEIVVTTISGVPYMWGPALARLEVIR